MMEREIIRGVLFEQVKNIFIRKKKKLFVVKEKTMVLSKDGANSDEVLNLELLSHVSKKKTKIKMMFGSIKRTFFLFSEYDCESLFMVLTRICSPKSSLVTFIGVLESIGDPCIIVNENLQIIGYNIHAQHILGYDKNDVFAQDIRMMLRDDHVKTDQIELCGLLNLENNTSKKITLMHKSKKDVIVFLNIGCYYVDGHIKINILTFRQDAVVQNDNDKKDKMMGKINEYCKGIKHLVSDNYENLSKIIGNQHHEISVLERYNKLYAEKIGELSITVRETQNKLNNFEQQNQRADLIKVLNHNEAFDKFYNFCVENRMEESLMFWKCVYDMKNKYISNPKNPELVNDVKYIYSKYIAVDATDQINISGKVTVSIKHDLENNKNIYNIFDDAAFEILGVLNDNAYFAFLDTAEGQRVNRLLL